MSGREGIKIMSGREGVKIMWSCDCHVIFSPKLVTSCNDGARKMERTEQLHFIHQKLDFGKLKVLNHVILCDLLPFTHLM